MGEQLNVHPEALRNWVRQDEADRGERDDRPSTDMAEENRAAGGENAEVRPVNEVMRAASTYFASDIRPDPEVVTSFIESMQARRFPAGLLLRVLGVSAATGGCTTDVTSWRCSRSASSDSLPVNPGGTAGTDGNGPGALLTAATRASSSGALSSKTDASRRNVVICGRMTLPVPSRRIVPHHRHPSTRVHGRSHSNEQPGTRITLAYQPATACDSPSANRSTSRP